MAAPVMSLGAPGNLLALTSVAAGRWAAAFLDVSAKIEGQVTCEVVTASPAASTVTVFSAFKVYGNATAQLVASAASSSSLVLSAPAVNMHPGQKIALIQTSGHGGAGELAAVSSISSSSVVIFSAALSNTYASGDGVYLIQQTAAFNATPTGSNGAYMASSDYSAGLFLGTGQWVVAAQNSDPAYATSVVLSVDYVSTFQ